MFFLAVASFFCAACSIERAHTHVLELLLLCVKNQQFFFRESRTLVCVLIVSFRSRVAVVADALARKNCLCCEFELELSRIVCVCIITTVVVVEEEEETLALRTQCVSA